MSDSRSIGMWRTTSQALTSLQPSHKSSYHRLIAGREKSMHIQELKWSFSVCTSRHRDLKCSWIPHCPFAPQNLNNRDPSEKRDLRGGATAAVSVLSHSPRKPPLQSSPRSATKHTIYYGVYNPSVFCRLISIFFLLFLCFLGEVVMVFFSIIWFHTSNVFSFFSSSKKHVNKTKV